MICFSIQGDLVPADLSTNRYSLADLSIDSLHDLFLADLSTGRFVLADLCLLLADLYPQGDLFLALQSDSLPADLSTRCLVSS